MNRDTDYYQGDARDVLDGTELAQHDGADDGGERRPPGGGTRRPGGLSLRALSVAGALLPAEERDRWWRSGKGEFQD
jgi:hypothetical protein